MLTPRLWSTQNLFSHPRYKDGAATSPNFDSFAFGCVTRKRYEATPKEQKILIGQVDNSKKEKDKTKPNSNGLQLNSDGLQT